MSIPNHRQENAEGGLPGSVYNPSSTLLQSRFNEATKRNDQQASGKTLLSIFNFLHQAIFRCGLVSKLPATSPISLPPDQSDAFKDDVLRIVVESIHNEIDTVCVNPFVRIHVCNESGTYISSLGTDQHNSSQHVKDVSVFQGPLANTNASKLVSQDLCDDLQYAHKQQSKTSFEWNQNLIMDLKYSNILLSNTIILIEVIDLHEEQYDASTSDEVEGNPVAWAFIKPRGRDGTIHVGHRKDDNGDSNPADDGKQVRLRLFAYQHDSWWIRHQAKRLGLSSTGLSVPRVFLQYLRQILIPYNASLSLRIGPTANPYQNTPERNNASLGLSQKVEEEGRHKEHYSFGEPNASKELSSKIVDRFARGVEEECIIPDTILYRLNHDGTSKVSFSHSGELLAIASNSVSTHLYIYELGDDLNLMYRSPHQNGNILDISWSMDDSFIASATSEGMISVHNIDRITGETKCVRLIPVEPLTHPTCLIFGPLAEAMIIFGSNDGSVSLWNAKLSDLSSSSGCLSQEGSSDELELVGGKKHHKAAVTSIVCDCSNGRVFTGDTTGCIMIWKPRKESSRRGKDFEVLSQLRVKDGIEERPILNLAIDCRLKKETGYCRGKKLLITLGGKSETLMQYDFTVHELLTFCRAAERDSFSVTTFSPDGEYVIGGTSCGRLIIMDSLGLKKKTRIDEMNLGRVTSISWNPTKHMVSISFKGDFPTLVLSAGEN